ncbi:MAG: hypothetical protein ABI867_38710, partial [Kofleriaceae bacterium]
MTGILDRVFDGIDDSLGVRHLGQAPHHAHASSFTRVASGSVDWVSLVFRTAARIEANWDKQASRDTRLWRLEPQQVPVCSGINGVADDRSVDHVHREGSRLALIELTTSADTPLRVVIEILVDGLLYRFARAHRHQLGL